MSFFLPFSGCFIFKFSFFVRKREKKKEEEETHSLPRFPISICSILNNHTQATQEWNEIQFNGVYYEPPRKAAPGVVPTSPDESYQFAYPRPKRPRALRIYECHIGMSSAEPKVNSYLEFARDMLPRIRAVSWKKRVFFPFPFEFFFLRGRKREKRGGKLTFLFLSFFFLLSSFFFLLSSFFILLPSLN